MYVESLTRKAISLCFTMYYTCFISDYTKCPIGFPFIVSQTFSYVAYH